MTPKRKNSSGSKLTRLGDRSQEIEDKKIEDRRQRSGDRGQETEVRRQKSGDRSQETEVRRQKSGDRGQKIEVRR